MKYRHFITEKEVLSLQHIFLSSKRHKEKCSNIELTNTVVSNRIILFQNDSENNFGIIKIQK
jgi:hypothetical protein